MPSLRQAYAADNIRVNAVAPGWIATPLTQALQDSDDRSQAILDRTPMKRWVKHAVMRKIAKKTSSRSFATAARFWERTANQSHA
jgi:NAD(P)-dependent dehydrogenase (short-subunit alcohol dehydrogenase family)